MCTIQKKAKGLYTSFKILFNWENVNIIEQKYDIVPVEQNKTTLPYIQTKFNIYIFFSPCTLGQGKLH